MEIIDLSQPLDETTPLYREPGGYADPPTRIARWVEIGESVGGRPSRFRVSRLELGLHTGTHLDAPAHFHPGAPTASDLPLDALAGCAVVVDVGGNRDGEVSAEVLVSYRGRASAPDALPLLITPAAGRLSAAAVRELIAWRRPLLAFAGPIDGDDYDYPATRALLGAGLWLATELDPARARRVRDGDCLIVAPLPLRGTEGAPCRVLAIRGLAGRS